MFRMLDDRIMVAPQIDTDQIADAKAQGVTLVINNRPDGESPSEPQGAEIEAAARAAGLDYVAIPVGHGGFSQPQVDAMAAALAGAEGKTLAYCRSGTRSTLLWALAEASQGADREVLTVQAAGGGYDLASIRPLMDMLATMLRRLKHGRKLMAADRSHLHYTLMDRGLGPRQTLALMAGYATLCASAGLLLEGIPEYLSLLCYFLLFCCHCLFVIRAGAH